MGDEKVPAVEQGVREIDIDLIDPNPEQPRTRFAEEKLAELAASIRSNGIVQPIVLRAIGSRYQIVAGERRWRAAQRAELRRLPAVVRDIPDDKLLEIALIENIQRHELNPIEEAKAYRKLIDSIGLTQEQVSERVGRERSLVATTMRLLKLPSEVQNHIIEGRLSLSHGRALLMADDPKVQRAVAKDIIERGLSVRETERTVKRAGNGGASVTDRPQPRAVKYQGCRDQIDAKAEHQRKDRAVGQRHERKDTDRILRNRRSGPHLSDDNGDEINRKLLIIKEVKETRCVNV
jgi:ParB family chromosome partitioning protein